MSLVPRYKRGLLYLKRGPYIHERVTDDVGISQSFRLTLSKEGLPMTSYIDDYPFGKN